MPRKVTKSKSGLEDKFNGLSNKELKKGAVKKAQQSPWIPSIWKPTGFNISHSKKELSNLEKRVQQTQRQKNCVFAVLKMWKIF